MIFALNVTQIALSVLLVIAILLQQRGGGLSPVFGGESGAYRTRRGVERVVFRATIVLAVLFFVAAAANFYLQNNAGPTNALMGTESGTGTSTVSVPEKQNPEFEDTQAPDSGAPPAPKENE